MKLYPLLAFAMLIVTPTLAQTIVTPMPAQVLAACVQLNYRRIPISPSGTLQTLEMTPHSLFCLDATPISQTVDMGLKTSLTSSVTLHHNMDNTIAVTLLATYTTPDSVTEKTFTRAVPFGKSSRLGYITQGGNQIAIDILVTDVFVIKHFLVAPSSPEPGTFGPIPDPNNPFSLWKITMINSDATR